LTARSHEVRPAYLQLTESIENTFDVYFKIPSRGNSIPKLEIIFPSNSELIKLGQPRFSDGFANFNFKLNLKKTLAGEEINIEGLKKTLIDVLVRIDYKNGEQMTFLLQPDKDTVVIPGKTSTLDVVKVYTLLGIEHILIGFDHLLFVLALLLISKEKWKLLKTITAFTIAHSITLSLATLGFASIPSAPVEAVIALSIVFLAAEILNIQKGHPSFTSKKPWLVAFIFGLLHGFGFASALENIGLPQQAIPFALGFFNVGVELGQLLFVTVILMLVFTLKKTKINFTRFQKIVPYAIGSIASVWMIERIIGFWS
jgi:hydrogenase/urease accessory protein HupE